MDGNTPFWEILGMQNPAVEMWAQRKRIREREISEGENPCLKCFKPIREEGYGEYCSEECQEGGRFTELMIKYEES